MKKFIATLLGLSLCGGPLLAQPNVQPHTLDATGCMKLRECTDDVIPITDLSQLTDLYGDWWDGPDSAELAKIIKHLNEMGVEAYLADGMYFERNNRGLYYTDVNRLFLNDYYMHNPSTLLEVLRHEGWHAAQDCMAGTVDNSFIAVILDDSTIPSSAKIITEARYGIFAPGAIPWEQEAYWAGITPDMTSEALEICAAGPMWEHYEPTPLTNKWLIQNGYIK